MGEEANYISIASEYVFDDKSGGPSFAISSKRPRSAEEMQASDASIQSKKAKFVSQIPTSIRILMASKDAGAVIGKGGSFIKSLRESYNANVLLPDCASPERILLISTTLANACSILMDIMKANEGPNRCGRDASLKMMVHQSQAGAIIGKNGANIKEFREKCKTMIKVYPECAPMSTERVVEIRGQIDVVANTVYTLVEFLQGFLPIGTIYPYDPIHCDQSFTAEYGGFVASERNIRDPTRGSFRGARVASRGGRGGLPGSFQQPAEAVPNGETFGCDVPGMGAFRGARGVTRGIHGFVPLMESEDAEGLKSFEEQGDQQAATQPVPANQPQQFQPGQVPFTGQEEAVEVSQVTIPSDLAGSIIGRGGARIKQIRQDSCATIDIDSPRHGMTERVITIRGTSSQIQHAQFLLQTSVKKYSGKY